MKMRRTSARSNIGIVDVEGGVKSVVRSHAAKRRRMKFKRRNRPWHAIAILLLASIACGLLYARHLFATTERASALPAFPPNWRNVHEQASLLSRCPQPRHSPKWDCYNDLVDENSDTVERANRVFYHDPHANTSGEEIEPGDRIPRLLIFTHKHDLFDCSVSASNSTTPNLYTLAENAKATVRSYSRVWPDMHFVFLSDDDCVDALNRTEPDLIPFFNDENLEGMFKADLCRVAYLSLHGGYYFDVDVLVVRPYVAPKNATFVTVKQWEPFGTFRGFFQAFLAAERDNPIVRLSLRIMLETLSGKRQPVSDLYLGPGSLVEAWMEVQNVTDLSNARNDDNNSGTYLLREANLEAQPHPRGSDLLQRVPSGHRDDCMLSTGSWHVCSYVVLDDDDERLYFYSRVLGTAFCGVCTSLAR